MVVEPLPSKGEVKKLYEEREEIEGKIRKLSPEPELPIIIDYDSSHYTDEGNATRFVALHKKNVRYVQAWERWMVWDGVVWKRRKSKQMTEYVREMTKRMREDAKAINDIKKSNNLTDFAAKTESYAKMIACINIAENDPTIAATPEDFDHDDMLLNVLNGTVDLYTGELLPHQRDKLISMIAPITYDENATAPEFEKFINTVLAMNPNLIIYLQRFFGSCLSGEVREKHLNIFHGKMDAGKTTLTELIADLLGDYADSIPIASLLSERKNSIPNDIAKLHNKRFVYSVEPEFGDSLSESTVKRLTGRDSIDARFLNQEWFRFKPKFKLVVACNNPPAIKHGGDAATWNRLKGLRFNVSIPKEKQDQLLPVKLREEAPGILNWLIAGCLAWQHEGVTNPEEIKIATSEYKEEQDKYSEFFNACCIEFPKEEEKKYGVTPSNLIYNTYKLWCEVNDLYPLAQNRFGNYLTNVRGYEAKDSRDDDNRKYRGYRGVRIVDDLVGPVNLMLISNSEEYYKKYITAKDTVRIVANKEPEKSLTNKDSNIKTDERNTSVSTGVFLNITPIQYKYAGNYGTNNHRQIKSVPVSESYARGNPAFHSFHSFQESQSMSKTDNLADSFHSFHSFHINSIITFIKDKYNQFNKPDSREELEGLKQSMRMNISNNIEESLCIEQSTIDKIIDDYCYARGWI